MLTLRRGDQSVAFSTMTVDVSPFEATFFEDTGWFGGPEIVYLMDSRL